MFPVGRPIPWSPFGPLHRVPIDSEFPSSDIRLRSPGFPLQFPLLTFASDKIFIVVIKWWLNVFTLAMTQASLMWYNIIAIPLPNIYALSRDSCKPRSYLGTINIKDSLPFDNIFHLDFEKDLSTCFIFIYFFMHFFTILIYFYVLWKWDYIFLFLLWKYNEIRIFVHF